MIALETLSGRVNGSGGVPLNGATVSFEGTTVLTDSSGSFLVPSVGALATGAYMVEIDGTTTSTTGVYSSLEVIVNIEAGQAAAVLSQVVTLPDLSNPDSAVQAVAVDADGAALSALALAGPGGDIALAGPLGTVITIAGVPALNSVDLNVTPVPADELPMPLPDDLVGTSFVTIQPGNSGFAVPGGGGLDVTLPNLGELPIGTSVDIWSFDHDVADWVNRSEETGNQGIVVDLGGGLTAVSATGVITEGGWHSPAIPIDVDCASEVIGRVVNSSGVPLPDVSLVTSFGQFASTGADGTFSMGLVPAYNFAGVTCTPVSFDITAAAPPLLGSVTGGTVTVPATDIQAGGVTDIGDLALAIPLTGCVAGIVNGTLDNPNADVELSGPTTTTLPLGASKTFSGCGLEPGAYTASILFAGESAPTSVSFDVVANAIATVTLQKVVVTTGDGDLTVTVVQSTLGEGADEPLSGVQVFLQGSNTSGLMLTDANGRATFDGVNGPFSITALRETVVASEFFNSVSRDAVSVLDLSPSGNQVTLAFDFDLDFDDAPQLDATLQGDFLGNPNNCPLEITISDRPDDLLAASDDGVLDDYSFGVPSGSVLDAFVTVQCGGGNTDITSAGLVSGIPALTPGETRIVDVDLSGPEFANFDHPLAVTIQNEVTAATTIREGDFQIFSTDTAAFGGTAELFRTTNAPGPSTWDLAPLDSGPFAGLGGRISYFVIAQTEQILAGQTQSFFRNVTGALPTSLDIELLPVPQILAPVGTIETASPGGLTMTIAPPATPTGMAGFEQLVFGGFALTGEGTNPLQGVLVTWNISMREGTTSLTLPSIAEQILGAGDYVGSLTSLRFAGVTIDYDEAFSSGGLLSGLTEEPETFVASANPFNLTVEAP